MHPNTEMQIHGKVRSPRCPAFELVSTSPPSGNICVRVICMAGATNAPPANTIGAVPVTTASISTSVSAPVPAPSPPSVKARDVGTFGRYLLMVILPRHIPTICGAYLDKSPPEQGIIHCQSSIYKVRLGELDISKPEAELFEKQ